MDTAEIKCKFKYKNYYKFRVERDLNVNINLL